MTSQTEPVVFNGRFKKIYIYNSGITLSLLKENVLIFTLLCRQPVPKHDVILHRTFCPEDLARLGEESNE